MYHRPNSDRHIGRHARHSAPANPPAAPPRDQNGSPIPAPPPRAVFNVAEPRAAAAIRTALHAAGGPDDALIALCWDALCATNPVALHTFPAQRDTIYRAPAVALAAKLRGALSAPRQRDIAEWVRDVCAALEPAVINTRARRCAWWILQSGEWRWEPHRRTR